MNGGLLNSLAMTEIVHMAVVLNFSFI